MRAAFEIFVITSFFIIVSLYFTVSPAQEVPKKSVLQEFIEKIRTNVPREKEEDEGSLVNLVGECPHMEGDYQCPIEDQLTDAIIIFNIGVDNESSEEEEVDK